MTVLAGDIVRYQDQDWVVVDLAGDDPPMAVLRADDDLDLMRPVAVLAEGLVAAGHLEHLDGWAEDDPGIWRVT
jgi:hypothetical protein